MSKVCQKFEVKFINHTCEGSDFFKTEFTAYTPKDVRNIVGSLSCFFSGDDYECFINGEKAVLEKDWGLA